MRLLTASSLLPVLLVQGSAIDREIFRRDNTPKYSYDPSTTEYCSWWYDNEENSIACKNMAARNGITQQQWERWNPAVAQSCSNFRTQQSYCIEAIKEPSSLIPSSTSQTANSRTKATTTKPGNGISTPTPIQPGMVDNCSQFYLVKDGDICKGVANDHGITLQQFISWNTQVGGRGCSSLLAKFNVCVNIIGRDASPTKPENGIQTPNPTQPNIIDTCDKFYKVKSRQSCVDVASANGIAVPDLISWNRKLTSDCSTLWADAYACVSAISKYDFETNMAGWNTVDGAFNAGSKALAATDPNGKAVVAAAMNDVIMEADVTLPGKGGNAGLIFRTSNASRGADAYRGYYAGISGRNGGYLVVGRADNSWSELGSAVVDIQPGRPYRLAVKALADQITVSIDGAEKISVTDGTFRSGSCGVRVYQTTATFDNVAIKHVLFDGFQKNMVGWSIADGGFDARSTVMVASNVDSGKAVLNTQFNDFALDVDITLSNDGGNAGVIFRASNVRRGADAYQGYYVGIDAGGWVTLGRANNNWVFLRNANVGIRVGRTYRLRVVARGSSISVYVADMDKAVLQVDDGTFSSGMVGARVYRTGAIYDNFAVVPF